MALHWVLSALHAAIIKARQEVERVANMLQECGVLRGEMEASPGLHGIGAAKTAYEVAQATDLQQQGVSDPSEYGRLVKEKAAV